MYLIAQYILKPVNSNTSAKNFWSDENNFIYDEVVGFARHLRNSDLAKASVILDLDEKELVKCRERTYIKSTVPVEKTYEEIHSYFYRHYANYMDAATLTPKITNSASDLQISVE